MNTEMTVVQQQQPQDEGLNMLAFMERANVTFGALFANGASLLPSSIQSVSDLVIAAAFGRRFGMDPMASVYNIHVIEGKPTLRADAIVGLCKSKRGMCRYFMLVESTGTIATYETHRDGEPSPTRMSFTYAEAEAADLTKPTKNGKPSNWKRFPAAMCRARAGVALARAVYPDVVGGIYYPGELSGDEGYVGVEGVPDVLVPEAQAGRVERPVRPGPWPASPDVQDAEVEEKPAPSAEEPKEQPAADAPNPRLLGLAEVLAKYIPKNNTAGALLHYLAASGKATAPTKEAARTWADSHDERAWTRVGENTRAALARRLEDCGAKADPTGLAYLAAVDHAPEAAAAGLQGEPSTWPKGAAWGVGIAARSRAEKAKLPPGEAALRKALDVPGGEDAVKLALAQVGAPWPTEDSDKGELAYTIEKNCQASACHADTVALLCDALAGTGEI